MDVERKTTVETAPEFELDTSDLTGFNLSMEPESNPQPEVEPSKPNTTSESVDTKPEVKPDNEPETEPEIDEHTVPVVSGEVVNLGFDNGEKPEVEPQSDDEPTSEEKPEETGDPLARGIYQTMVDRGYIKGSEEFKGSMEEIDELFTNLPTVVFNATFQEYPDDFQKLLAYGWEKGTDVTVEDLAGFFKDYIKETISPDSIDISTETTAMDFVVKELVATGDYDLEDATMLAEKWQDKDQLLTKAEKFKTRKLESVNKDADAALADIRSQNEEKRKKDLAKAKSVKEAIESTPWNNQRKQVVFDDLFSDGFKNKSQKISENPKALVQLANYMSFFNEETGEIDETAYKKQAFSKEAKKIKSDIEKNFGSVSFAKSSTVQQSKNADEEWEFA
jgi:hypothetical protein